VRRIGDILSDGTKRGAVTLGFPCWPAYMRAPTFWSSSTRYFLCTVRNRMLVSLRGGRGELDNLKPLTYGFTNLHKDKLEHTI
jgi:hypothetical protein